MKISGINFNIGRLLLDNCSRVYSVPCPDGSSIAAFNFGIIRNTHNLLSADRHYKKFVKHVDTKYGGIEGPWVRRFAEDRPQPVDNDTELGHIKSLIPSSGEYTALDMDSGTLTLSGDEHPITLKLCEEMIRVDGERVFDESLCGHNFEPGEVDISFSKLCACKLLGFTLYVKNGDDLTKPGLLLMCKDGFVFGVMGMRKKK